MSPLATLLFLYLVCSNLVTADSSSTTQEYLEGDRNGLAIGYCDRGTKCGQPCDTNADCTPPEGGQCWKEVKCGHCNYLSHYKCGEVCGADLDCSPGQCWADITTYECDDILKFYCDADSASQCGKQCETEQDAECSSGHCVTYQAHCGNSSLSGYCSLESGNCGSSCVNNSECSGGGYCLLDKEKCTSAVTIGTYTGALPGIRSVQLLRCVHV